MEVGEFHWERMTPGYSEAIPGQKSGSRECALKERRSRSDLLESRFRPTSECAWSDTAANPVASSVSQSPGNLRSPRNVARCSKIFDKDHLVLCLVVEQLIGHRAGHGNAEAARAHSELVADGHMCDGFLRRLTNGSVCQALEAEA